MAAKGYCTIFDVTGITGDLTAVQSARAASLIEVAEVYIDGELGRGWLVGTQTLEAIYLPSDYIKLRYWPVTSVTAVYGREGLDDIEDALTVDDDYEVQDLAAGIIRIYYPGYYDRIRVTYVPNDAVPDDIALATADLVAAWMLPTIQAGSYGLDSYSLPDLSVKFSRSHYQQPVPPLARAILDRYREPVHG
jgi:hypothetical protein